MSDSLSKFYDKADDVAYIVNKIIKKKLGFELTLGPNDVSELVYGKKKVRFAINFEYEAGETHYLEFHSDKDLSTVVTSGESDVGDWVYYVEYNHET